MVWWKILIRGFTCTSASDSRVFCVEPRKHSGQQRMRGSTRPQTRCLCMALVWQTMVSRLVLDRSNCSCLVACMAIATRLFDENRPWYTNTWAVNIRSHATLHASIYFCPNVKCSNKVGARMLDLTRTNKQPCTLHCSCKNTSCAIISRCMMLCGKLCQINLLL